MKIAVWLIAAANQARQQSKYDSKYSWEGRVGRDG